MARYKGTDGSAAALLRRWPGWRIVPGGVLRSIDDMAVPITLKKTDVLVRRGEFAAALFVVSKGLLKVAVQNSDGREQVLYYAGEGMPIIEAYLPGDLLTRVKVVAERDSALWRIPTDHLTALVASSPQLALAMLRLYAFRLVRRDDLIVNKTGRLVSARLAEFFYERASRQASSPPIVIKRTLTGAQIAIRLGTTREEVTRALSRLRDRGILTFNTKEIVVLDLEQLSVAATTG